MGARAEVPLRDRDGMPGGHSPTSITTIARPASLVLTEINTATVAAESRHARKTENRVLAVK